MTLRFAQIGNYGADHSTENELRKAIGFAGHDVVCFEESNPSTFVDVADAAPQFDVILWTKIDRDPPLDFDAMRAMLSEAANCGVPTVAYHLDLWHGIHRQDQVGVHPFFQSEVVVTADGGHDLDFAAAGVNHHWMPPGVSEAECSGGTKRHEYVSDVAFVGSWRGYHPEHRHRAQLVRWLQLVYRDRCQFWPRPGHHAIRGPALRDLYASTKVNVGDSCFAGAIANYWSDRIPETLGRGGFLIHPYVDGIEDHFTDGEHLRLWQVGDWRELRRLVDHYLAHDDERERIAAAGRAHVLEHHTYTVRIHQLVALLAKRGVIPAPVPA